MRTFGSDSSSVVVVVLVVDVVVVLVVVDLVVVGLVVRRVPCFPQLLFRSKPF